MFEILVRCVIIYTITLTYLLQPFHAIEILQFRNYRLEHDKNERPKSWSKFFNLSEPNLFFSKYQNSHWLVETNIEISLLCQGWMSPSRKSLSFTEYETRPQRAHD